jgi:hypothetical protein
LVAGAILVRMQARRWIRLSLSIGIVAQGALLFGDAFADRLSIPGLPKADLYQRTMGWRALGERAATLASATGARSIAGERRDDVASLLYYARTVPVAVLAWPGGTAPTHQFELSRPLTSSAPEPILLISHCAEPARLGQYYRNVEDLGAFAVPTGPNSVRRYHAFKLSGALGPIGALARCR